MGKIIVFSSALFVFAFAFIHWSDVAVKPMQNLFGKVSSCFCLQRYHSTLLVVVSTAYFKFSRSGHERIRIRTETQTVRHTQWPDITSLSLLSARTGCAQRWATSFANNSTRQDNDAIFTGPLSFETEMAFQLHREPVHNDVPIDLTGSDSLSSSNFETKNAPVPADSSTAAEFEVIMTADEWIAASVEIEPLERGLDHTSDSAANQQDLISGTAALRSRNGSTAEGRARIASILRLNVGLGSTY